MTLKTTSKVHCRSARAGRNMRYTRPRALVVACAVSYGHRVVVHTIDSDLAEKHFSVKVDHVDSAAAAVLRSSDLM